MCGFDCVTISDVSGRVGGAAGPGGTAQFGMAILGKWQCHSFALSPRSQNRAVRHSAGSSHYPGAGLKEHSGFFLFIIFLHV